MSEILKARTLPTRNNKRISWRNVSYFTYKDIDDHMVIDIYWKYKASIISEEVLLKFDHNAARQKFFKTYGIVHLNDNIYINLNQILIIEEEIIHGAEVKIKVKIIFTDGFKITTNIPEDNWLIWKRNYA
jgi:hypothetical protein